MADHALRCFRCGESLATLSLPLGQRDACPSCSIFLHVCRMCRFYDPAVARKCREDDAEEVTDKENMNFCAWFSPSPHAFDPLRAAAAKQGESRLAALFGDAGDGEATDPVAQAAEDLFK